MRYNHLMKLGREKSPKDRRTISLSDIWKIDALDIPVDCHWDRYISDWGIMGNDRYGNCVTVSKAHMIMAWLSNTRKQDYSIADSYVITESRAIGGLNGFNILASVKLWRKRGFFGDKIWAFADLSLNNALFIQAAVSYFGCVELGVNLPNAWKGADVWNIGNGRDYTPGSWGGHSVPIVGYDSQYVYVISWGEIIPMTWDALPIFCDEAYTFIDANWLSSTGNTPVGLNLELIHQKLRDIENTAFE